MKKDNNFTAFCPKKKWEKRKKKREEKEDDYELSIVLLQYNLISIIYNL
jgi:hypothetical protein